MALNTYTCITAKRTGKNYIKACSKHRHLQVDNSHAHLVSIISSTNMHRHDSIVSFVWQYAYEFDHYFCHVVSGMLIMVANEPGYPCVFSPAKYIKFKRAMTNRHPAHIMESYEVTFLIIGYTHKSRSARRLAASSRHSCVSYLATRITAHVL